ncbi:MAG: TIGR02300 family protein [Mangrovicoccus sp.]
MPKEEWGTKRVCPTTGKRFYDLGRDPVVSPYTGEVVPVNSGGKTRTMIADAADKANPANAVEDDEDVVLDDDDADAADMDLGDDVLETEEDNVSLDDLTEMSSDDDDDS